MQDANRVEMRASGVQLTDELRRDLEEVLRKHGGKLETFGHPTTTLEDCSCASSRRARRTPAAATCPDKDERAGAAPAAPPAPQGDRAQTRR